MKMLKKTGIPPQVVFFLLMLLGSSSPLFSANDFAEPSAFQEDSRELWSNSLGAEQIITVNGSILPLQKNLVFLDDFSGRQGEYDALVKIHSTGSASYIIWCRYIIPSLGIREVIFPFHVFL